MGLLSRVFGSKGGDDGPSTSAPEGPHAVPDAPLASQQSLNIPTAPDAVPAQVGAMLKPPEDAAVMYNPYAGLHSTTPRTARAFRVPQQPEFVFQEEASVRRRGFGENLGFYTGSGYLSGAVAGGAVGLAQATVLARAGGGPSPPLASRRLLLNRLLNAGGQTGRLAGNTLGTLGLLFAVSESLSGGLLDAYAPDVPPWAATVAAGAAAGAIFRAPRGSRASAITAVFGAGAAAALLAARQVYPGL